MTALQCVTGPLRIGTRTKDLTRRLGPGDIAVLDHADLDQVAADGLLERNVVAIVNGAASITGRYPNVGPLRVVNAGVALLDRVGSDTVGTLTEGNVATLVGDRLFVDGRVVATGRRQNASMLRVDLEHAKSRIGSELQKFAENTLAYMRAEQFLLLDQPRLPPLRVNVRGRDVVVVVRGDQFREDLNALQRYFRDVDPVIYAVDGAADTVVAAGMRPDVIIGDFDSVSTSTLHCGAQLIVHAYPTGEAPGAKRLCAEGLAFDTFALAGTSEDIAILLAYEKGADLIVAVGTHVSLIDFLDKGRSGMASTFLTRLKVGPILIDARGFNKLYEPRVRTESRNHR